MAISDNHQCAKIKSLSTFDNFCHSVDKYHFIF